MESAEELRWVPGLTFGSTQLGYLHFLLSPHGNRLLVYGQTQRSREGGSSIYRPDLRITRTDGGGGGRNRSRTQTSNTRTSAGISLKSRNVQQRQASCLRPLMSMTSQDDFSPRQYLTNITEIMVQMVFDGSRHPASRLAFLSQSGVSISTQDEWVPQLTAMQDIHGIRRAFGHGHESVFLHAIPVSQPICAAVREWLPSLFTIPLPRMTHPRMQ